MPYLDNIFYSSHALERMEERDIRLSTVERVLRNGEVIERYETDEQARYLMHYREVIPAEAEGRTGFELHYHVVAADQSVGRTVVITVYDPTDHPERWSDDYKRRIE